MGLFGEQQLPFRGGVWNKELAGLMAFSTKMYHISTKTVLYNSIEAFGEIMVS